LRIYNNYIISLTLAAGVVNALLAFFGQPDLSIYFIVNIVAYLAITLLYVYLNPRARRALSTIAAVFFAGFLVVVAIKVVAIVAVG
jgi:TRAP-type C4-dicarboxylate transport system permease small subunit